MTLHKTTIISCFCECAGLDATHVTAADPTLGDIVRDSDQMHNSVDLMEAFAKTSNRIKKEHGVRLRLPAYPLDTRLSVVVDALVAQLSGEAP
jgi:hypothetical protein